ncbi:MAG: transposase [Chitinophagaceae bacterium]|nr:MAG: transposase [Chitinophagaceae bacterium]
MKEKMLQQFAFSEQVKEEIIRLVLYQQQSAKAVAQKYGLPNVHIIANWIRIYKKKLETGAITLPPMQKPKRKDTKALKRRIQQLEKSLDKANVLIYGLNAMIDYAEKELKVPVRKKPGTKQ